MSYTFSIKVVLLSVLRNTISEIVATLPRGLIVSLKVAIEEMRYRTNCIRKKLILLLFE
jgi:hypothetical protein